MIDFLIAATALALAILLIVDLVDLSKRRKIERELEEIEKKRKEDEIFEQRRREREYIENQFNTRYGMFVEKYGACTADILLGEKKLDINDHLYIFEDSSMMVLRGEVLPFNKILGFSLDDDSRTIMKNDITYTSTTKTSTGSMIGRAAVGGILLGGVGALAGAATAKQTTTTEPLRGQTTATTEHDYHLFLNVDSISNPTREIHFGDRAQLARTVANTINVIIQRNNRLNNA